MWNELATGFEVNTCAGLEQHVIIAVSSCWAKRFAGGLQLSATPATSYYLNPSVTEAEHIRQLYNELLGPPPALQLPSSESLTQQREIAQTPMPISAIMELNPDTHTQLTTQAVITRIDESKGWYFNRCRTCHTKISEGMPHWHCQQLGTQQRPNYSYCFKATLADVTGSIVVTCFSPEAEDFQLLPECSEILSYTDPDPDPYVLPPIIRALENTTHVFKIHFAVGS